MAKSNSYIVVKLDAEFFIKVFCGLAWGILSALEYGIGSTMGGPHLFSFPSLIIDKIVFADPKTFENLLTTFPFSLAPTFSFALVVFFAPSFITIPLVFLLVKLFRSIKRKKPR